MRYFLLLLVSYSSLSSLSDWYRFFCFLRGGGEGLWSDEEVAEAAEDAERLCDDRVRSDSLVRSLSSSESPRVIFV